MVLRYDGLCFAQRRKPPLDLKVFVPSNAFHNSAFLYEQLEFAWVIGICAIAIKAGREIDAPGSDPIPLYHALGR